MSDNGFGGADGQRVTVKWFNVQKGFGFGSVDGAGHDAFIHISVVQRAGYEQLAPNAELTCVLGQGPRGPVVEEILSVSGNDAPAASHGGGPRGGGGYHDHGEEDDLDGAVKWYNPEKGFGFITPDDGGKDIFIHKSVLRRCHIDMLEPGQRVQMKVAAAAKGREATWLSLG